MNDNFYSQIVYDLLENTAPGNRTVVTIYRVSAAQAVDSAFGGYTFGSAAIARPSAWLRTERASDRTRAIY